MNPAVEDRTEGRGSLLDLCGALEPEAAEELARANERSRRERRLARREVE